MRALALAAAVLFTVVEARADDDTIQLDTEPRVVPAPPAFAPPATIEEFRLRIKERKAALAAARAAGDPVAEDAIRGDIAQLNAWYGANTHKLSAGMFTGGIVLLAAGGGALVVGALVFTFGVFANSCVFCSRSSGDQTAVTAGAILMLAGAIVGVAAIPILVIGNKRVIGPPDEASLFIGPTGVYGTF